MCCWILLPMGWASRMPAIAPRMASGRRWIRSWNSSSLDPCKDRKAAPADIIPPASRFVPQFGCMARWCSPLRNLLSAWWIPSSTASRGSSVERKKPLLSDRPIIGIFRYWELSTCMVACSSAWLRRTCVTMCLTFESWELSLILYVHPWIEVIILEPTWSCSTVSTWVDWSANSLRCWYFNAR